MCNLCWYVVSLIRMNASVFNQQFLPTYLLWERIIFNVLFWVSANGFFSSYPLGIHKGIGRPFQVKGFVSCPLFLYDCLFSSINIFIFSLFSQTLKSTENNSSKIIMDTWMLLNFIAIWWRSAINLEDLSWVNKESMTVKLPYIDSPILFLWEN